MAWLQSTLGYARLAPYLDQADPQIQGMLDNMYYAGSSYDQYNPLGDPFTSALAVLGAAVGGASLYGALGGAAEAAGTFAGGAGTDLLYGGAVGGDLLAGGGGAGLTAGQAAALGGGGAGALGGSAALGGAGGGGAGFLAGAAPAAAAAAPAAAGSLGGILGSIGPYAPLIGTGLTVAGNLAGGAIASGAAKSAANTQAAAAAEANRILQQQYEQSRADLAPYREAGYRGLAAQEALTNQPIGFDPYTATPTLDPAQYAFTAPNQPLDPAAYKFAPTTGQQVLDDDPGYQFRLSEGMKALQSTNAAKGGLLSGGAVKGALKYGQGLASQEYEKSYARGLARNEQDWNRAIYGNEMTYNRALKENELGYGRSYQQNADLAARNRDQYSTNYQAQMGTRQQRFNELASLTGLGQTATKEGNLLGANLGGALSGNITGAGAARAAGDVGSANAWSGALGGIGNAANNYLQYSLLSQQLANQQRQPTYGYRGPYGGGYGF
jgi:hypothetical protein